jgi:hypothetical protein
MTMKRASLSPANIALADELLAYARDHVTELAQGLRIKSEQNGTVQASADYVAYLTSIFGPDYLAVLTVVAIGMIPPPADRSGASDTI